MLVQSREIDRLRGELAAREAELAERDRQLADRSIAISKAGSIAEASLRLSGVFQDAQRAADLYLANVRAMQGQASAGQTDVTGASSGRAADDRTTDAERDGHEAPDGELVSDDGPTAPDAYVPKH